MVSFLISIISCLHSPESTKAPQVDVGGSLQARMGSRAFACTRGHVLVAERGLVQAEVDVPEGTALAV